MAKPNFKSGTIWTGDNLAVMSGINSECIDLIYLDAPLSLNMKYKVPIRQSSEKAKFDDIWKLTDISDSEHELIRKRNAGINEMIRVTEKTHSGSMKSYMIFMASRLMEIHRILKETGSVYLHCDQTASHYLKVLLDGIFGKDNFLNEIIWAYKARGINKGRRYVRAHDCLLFYSKDRNKVQFNEMKEISYDLEAPEPQTKSGENLGVERDKLGKFRMTALGDWIVEYGLNPELDIKHLKGKDRERLGFPTQKPLKLLDRIIQVSSNVGDLVFDPFCGCATTLVAAERIGRNWAGVDISPMAVELLKQRLLQDQSGWGHEQFPIKDDIGLITNVQNPSRFPVRSDTKKLPSYKIYKRELYGQQEGHCAGCGTIFEIVNLEIDHIMPLSEGGQSNIDNLQLLCGNCNLMKGNRNMEYLMSRLEE